MCIFCKIAQKEIPSACIWEDNEFISILDINPNTRGMALVLTKEHYDSYAFRMPSEVYARFMNAAREVAGKLERGLPVERVALVMEGMGVDHAHLKLYPLHGVGREFKEMLAHERVFFENYEGYLTTQLGPPADPAALAALAEKIRNA